MRFFILWFTREAEEFVVLNSSFGFTSAPAGCYIPPVFRSDVSGDIWVRAVCRGGSPRDVTGIRRRLLVNMSWRRARRPQRRKPDVKIWYRIVSPQLVPFLILSVFYLDVVFE